MAVKKLQLIQELPEFDMPDKYKADIWKVTSWEIYTNATEKCQQVWDRRSAISDGNFDFTKCENLYIREELKYIVSLSFEKGLKISSISEIYDRMKIIFGFVNKDLGIYSITEYENRIHEFEMFLSQEWGNKVTIKSSPYINKNMEKVELTRSNRAITLFKLCIKTINEYRNRNKSLMELDSWNYDVVVKYDSEAPKGKILHFENIVQPTMKQASKVFARFKLGTLNVSTIASYTHTVEVFSKWLADYDESIKHFDELIRDIIEDFFLYLRVESDISDHQCNVTILQLKVFFETIQLLEVQHAPDKILILPEDSTIKSKTESRYFTDEEAQNITNAIKYMNKTDGKMVFCLKVLGLRLSELRNLKPENIVQNDDGSYSLNIYQNKTKKEYLKPLTKEVSTILLSEIAKNKKRFNCEPEYVFLTDKGTKIEHSAFIRRMNMLFYEHKVKDRNGDLLRFQSHRFRATFATSLINAGYGAEATSKALGQTCLKSLMHYIHISDETTIRQLSPKLERDDYLIRNIQSMSMVEEIPQSQSVTKLCNGWCTRDITKLGVCKKANACISCSLFQPTIEHLNNYEMQLQEVNATIEVARQNEMDVILQSNLKLKEDLERIIKQVKERLDEKK